MRFGNTSETSNLKVKNNAHLTAIARKALPTPVRWLQRQGFVIDNPSIAVLDFGCGKCASVNPKHWDNYDPHYAPDGIPSGKKYNIILCTYVLCVLSPEDRPKVLKKIRSLLSEWGCAYITVRADRPKNGWGKSSRGTYQGRVKKLALPLLHQNSQFRIYQLTRNTKLV